MCIVYRAALGDEDAFKWLVDAEEYNRHQFAFTIMPCRCDPPCARPTNEQRVALNNRVADVVQARQAARPKPGPVPKFDKWIFPVIKNMGEMPELKDLK